jgi:choline dehydrogenase-like flavoprotein
VKTTMSKNQLTDARDLPAGARLSATVLVVGTGPAGATVARELAPTGVDILMLEGGDVRGSTEADDTLKGEASSQAVEPLEKARTKRLGGASMQWGGRAYPFDRLDFEERRHDDFSTEAWPVTRDQLLPYYRRAAQALDLRSFEWTGAQAIPGDPEDLIGPSKTINSKAVWRWSPPIRFAGALSKDLASYPNIRVMHHANVTHVVQNPETGVIDRVEGQTQPGRHFTARGMHVVIAAGGLETARILLNSGVRDDHDQIGRHYMIHPIAEVGELRVRDPKAVGHSVTPTKSHDGVWVRRLLQPEEQVRREQGLLNMGFAVWYQDPRTPDHGDPLLSSFALVRKLLTMTGGFKGTGMHRRYARLEDPRGHVLNVLRGLPAIGAFGVRWVRDRILDPRTLPMFSRYSKQGVYRIRFDAEQSPDPEQRVVLSTTERDAFGVPRLDVRHRVSDADRRNYHRSLEILAQGIKESGWGTYTPPTLDDMLGMTLVDATHQMGLVRMGFDPTRSVVDPNLRVWSSPNLYLATTGTFPTAGMAGPTLTDVALSIRLADHLARKLQREGDR